VYFGSTDGATILVVRPELAWWTRMVKFSDFYLKGLQPKASRYAKTERNGFYIEVMPSGEKSFRYRYRLNGQREKVTIGSYPSMTLKVARIRHSEMLDQVNLGVSPARAKRDSRLQAAAGLISLDTFEPFAEKWIQLELRPNNKNARQDETYIRRDIVPKVGKKELKSITTQDVC
jgi:hypothetical protein